MERAPTLYLELQDAGISYGEVDLFRGLSTTMPERQVTALVGPSGAGKSSLLAALAGYQPLSSGHVTYVDGTTRHGPISELVVWVPQGANALPNRSALDNVAVAALSNGIDRAEAEAIGREHLAAVGLSDRVQTLAKKLSGGELQRLAMARAMTGSRPLVFADEPSSGLDVTNVRLIAETLRQLSRVATVIVATHDELIRDMADHVVDLRLLQ